MQTTVDLDPEAYQEAQRRAAERGQSLGEVLSEAILLAHHSGIDQHVEAVAPLPVAKITRDAQGFPQIDIGRPLTLEEVRAAVEEE